MSSLRFRPLLAVPAVVVMALLLSGCPASNPEATSDGSAPVTVRPGFATGRVIDMASRPIEGALVRIYGTTMAGANTSFEVHSGADGSFSQKLPEGIYGLSAYHEARLNGRVYRFTLAPTDGITARRHDSSEGIAKTFEWKISGLRHGQEPGEPGTYQEPFKYHGGAVHLTSREVHSISTTVYFPRGSRLIIDCEPKGPLIDGRTGERKTFERTFAQDQTSSLNWYLVDLPVGVYDVSARLVLPDGIQRRIGIKDRQKAAYEDPFGPSTTIDFEPTSNNDLTIMQVAVDPGTVL